MNHLVRNCLLIGSLSFAAFFIVSLLLARWAVKPVEVAWTQQRQFVADASHELKTPLTVILSSTQLLREEGADETTRARLTDNIFSMSRQMKRLQMGGAGLDQPGRERHPHRPAPLGRGLL